MAAPVIAFDTETALIRPGLLVPPLACVSVAWDGDRPAWVEPGADTVVRGSTALFDASAARRVAPALFDRPPLDAATANGVYDLAVLAENDPTDRTLRAIFEALGRGTVTDVQIRERLYANAFGRLKTTRVSLADLVRRYLGPERGDAMDATKAGDDVWRLRYAELIGVPLRDWPADAVTYALDDARATLEVHHAQSARIPAMVDGFPLRNDRMVVSEDREMRAAFALHLQAAWGVRTDAPVVEELTSRWIAIAKKGREIGQAGGWVRPDGTTNKKVLQAVVTDAFGGHPPLSNICGRAWAGGECTKAKKHKGECGKGRAGQVSLKVDTLIEAADLPGAPEHLREYAETLLAGRYNAVWTKPLWHATKYPSTYKSVSLLETGRASIQQPPWQQPARSGGLTVEEKKAKTGLGVRDCVIPRPGHVLCSVDFAAAELGALGQVHIWWGLSREMANAINAGRDLHIELAANLSTAQGAPLTYDEAFALYKQPRPDPRIKELRQVAKIANFGFGGGMGAAKFVVHAAKQGVTITLEMAELVRAVWLRSWPAMNDYFRAVSALTRDGRKFTVQHPVSGRLRGNVGYTDGNNGYFQGLVADGAKAAAYSLAFACYVGDPNYPALLGCRPCLFLHDEIIAEIPVDRQHEAGHEMADIMRLCLQAHTPDVLVGAKPALMDRWYKDADPVYDDRGRLVLWQPKVKHPLLERIAA